MHICGSLLYTIRPIQEAINLFNENQFARVEADLTKQHVVKKLVKFGHETASFSNAAKQIFSSDISTKPH